ncbi:hypothetical protein GCM10010123_27430 [Pilimelia anulata]|uniref:DUF4360 domain-containing protein n=1 Tax=Pilimelia anulata TaxID=53371 RepID=A0A8J3B8M6_9ACTN|nr:DUF4360 domain-containing protein [Pilimelia anulata]GGJ96027.1 hypothetical protein GCM10010123_27430 [Pilimelia anulata]
MNRTHLVRAAASAVAVLGAAGLPAPAAAAPAGTDPDVQVRDVTLNGTGCRKGDTSIVLSNGNRAIEVLFSTFTVRAGLVAGEDGAPTWLARATKNCVINLTLSYHAGYTFALTSLGVRGYADLPAGAVGKQTTTHYFAGAPQTGRGTWELKGPKTDGYAYDDEIATPDWSTCGKPRAINLNMRVQVVAGESPRDSTSGMTLDRQAGRLSWKNC